MVEKLGQSFAVTVIWTCTHGGLTSCGRVKHVKRFSVSVVKAENLESALPSVSQPVELCVCIPAGDTHVH